MITLLALALTATAQQTAQEIIEQAKQTQNLSFQNKTMLP